jgi:hypothetical protein
MRKNICLNGNNLAIVMNFPFRQFDGGDVLWIEWIESLKRIPVDIYVCFYWGMGVGGGVYSP